MELRGLNGHPNIEVRFFNPVANRRWRGLSFLSDFGRVNNRMHNKLFIMDNALGIAGGRNIADVYFGVGREDQNFRDLDVVTAGPVVRDLSASFDLFWNSKSAVPVGALVAERVTKENYLVLRKQMMERISTTGYPYPVDERLDDLRARLVEIRDAFTWAPGRVLADDPARVSYLTMTLTSSYRPSSNASVKRSTSC